MILHTYFNECSLNGQFNKDVETALRDFLSMHALTSRIDDSVFYILKQNFSNIVITNNGCKLSDLSRLVKAKVVSKETVDLFRDIIQKARTAVIASPDRNYSCNNKSCNNTNLVAAYEDSVQNAETKIVLLASFPNGGFNVAHVDVKKDGTNLLAIPNVTSPNGMRSFLANNNLLKSYDPNSTSAPTDGQTLCETNPDFEYTKKREQYTNGKRKVYLHKPTGDYWYVDSAHADGEAHYEVFSKNLKFRGTVSFFEKDLSKIRKPSKNKKGRTLVMA